MTSQKEKSAQGSTSQLHQKMNPEDAEQILKDSALLEHPSFIELQNKLTEAEEKATQNWDRLLRQQADMDNQQRRAERDIANAHKYALEKFIPELLPVIDSMERSLEISSAEHSVNAVLEGINLTLKMFYGVLEKADVLQIDPKGQPFNPDFHQAVSVLENSGEKPGTVVNVLQKGYTLNNRLIRPALVVVAK
ncbi:MAG: nucleotide exchange factor GrpE [Pseudomonadota bacterium]